MIKEVKFINGFTDRRFTKDWASSGLFNLEKVPDLVQTLVNQRSEMIDYIEALHDKIDWILSKNNCCDIPSCLTAGCTSDHK